MQTIVTFIFFLKKQKSFIPKKKFLSHCQYQNKEAWFTDLIFPKVLILVAQKCRHINIFFIGWTLIATKPTFSISDYCQGRIHISNTQLPTFLRPNFWWMKGTMSPRVAEYPWLLRPQPHSNQNSMGSKIQQSTM